MRLPIAILAAALGGCSTVSGLRGDREDRAPDATLAAFQNARVVECPAGRRLDGARIGSDNDSSGVTTEDVALTPLANAPGYALRLRRLTVAPRGVIAWHEHNAIQGMALIVSGEMTEFRNTCMDPIRYRAGDIAREDAGTAHGWRNETNRPAVIMVAHVVRQ